LEGWENSEVRQTDATRHPSRAQSSATILAFKAGRAFRREGTNFVDASPVKGAVILQKGDDELLHFIWKDRSTNEVEEVANYHICEQHF